jgi:hypothetical protein
MSKRKTKKNIKSITGGYTLEDYSSNDGMLTSIWGPSTWHLLHCISFNYPINPTTNDKQKYMKFILSIKNILPCGKCRKNLVQNFKKLPLSIKDMKTRESFSTYVFNLHEIINTMLGKKSGLSYEKVRDTYEHFRARCTRSISKMDEKGCIVPFHGKKTKCVLSIVPEEKKCKTFI